MVTSANANPPPGWPVDKSTCAIDITTNPLVHGTTAKFDPCSPDVWRDGTLSTPPILMDWPVPSEKTCQEVTGDLYKFNVLPMGDPSREPSYLGLWHFSNTLDGLKPKVPDFLAAEIVYVDEKQGFQVMFSRGAVKHVVNIGVHEWSDSVGRQSYEENISKPLRDHELGHAKIADRVIQNYLGPTGQIVFPKVHASYEKAQRWAAYARIRLSQTLLNNIDKATNAYDIASDHGAKQTQIGGESNFMKTWSCENEDENAPPPPPAPSPGPPNAPPFLPSPGPGNVWGDPHLTRFDGSTYDFQAVGEFILVETVDDYPLEMQIRTKPVKTSLSVISAAAFQVEEHRVVFYTPENRAQRQIIVGIDGVLTDFEIDKAIRFPSGGSVTQVAKSPSGRHRYRVTWANGTEVLVHESFTSVAGPYLNLFISLASAHLNNVAGLLGNSNGDPNDDFLLRNGTPATELYPEYADSWRVTATSSLFDYAPGNSTTTFTDLNFPLTSLSLSNLSEGQRKMAKDACEAVGILDPATLDACMLDVAVFHDTAAADVAIQVQEEADAWNPAGCVVRFDGLNDFITIPHRFDSAQFTFEAWIYTNSVSRNRFITGTTIATYGQNKRKEAWGVWLMTPKRGPVSDVGVRTELNVEKLNSSPWAVGEAHHTTHPIGINRWAHVAVAYDGTSSLRVYIDGVEVAKHPWTTPINTSFGGELILGMRSLGLPIFFGGLMDEVRVWSVARTAQEIADSWNHKVDSNSNNLEAYYDFDECRGQKVYDSTPHMRHGYLGQSSAPNSQDPEFVPRNVVN